MYLNPVSDGPVHILEAQAECHTSETSDGVKYFSVLHLFCVSVVILLKFEILMQEKYSAFSLSERERTKLGDKMLNEKN